MKNLYQRMLEIADEVAEETKFSESPLFAHKQDDLYEFDRDIIENDATPGDEYLWSIRGTGHGTDIFRLNGDEHIADYLLNAGSKTRCFHIKVNDIGQGEIYPVSFEQVEELAKTDPNPNRIPRRELMVDAMSRIIGLKDGYKYDRVLGVSEQPAPSEGAVTMVKTTPVRGGVEVSVAQTRSGKAGENGKSVDRHFVSDQYVDLSKQNALTGEGYFRVKTPTRGYAITEAVSKRSYDSTVSCFQKRLEQNRYDFNME